LEVKNGGEDVAMIAADGAAAGLPVVTPESACLWSGCGKLFGRLEELVGHIHKGKPTPVTGYHKIKLNDDPRTRRNLQGYIQMHVGRLSIIRSDAYFPLRTHRTHTFSHRRTSFYMQTTRYAVFFLPITYLPLTAKTRMRQILHPLRRINQTHESRTLNRASRTPSTPTNSRNKYNPSSRRRGKQKT